MFFFFLSFKNISPFSVSTGMYLQMAICPKFVLGGYGAFVNGHILRADFFFHPENLNWCPSSFSSIFMRHYVFSSTCVELASEELDEAAIT